MEKNSMKKKIGYGAIVAFVLLVYYQVDLKRHFISSDDNSKHFTIWRRTGNKCYIIPGRYFGIFPPKENYIKTVNFRNYIGVVWNTLDDYEYKISIYNDFEPVDLKENIKIYSRNDSLLLEYNILKELNYNTGKRIRSDSAEILEVKYDFKYIDLNQIYGIKIW
jgi:hypothetical protein